MLKTENTRFYGLIVITFIFLLSIVSINAATFTVTKITDTNDGVCDADCSLREAIAMANVAPTDDLIRFGDSFSTARTITLGGQPLDILNNGRLTIYGRGVGLLTISGNDLNRIFITTVGSNFSIADVTLEGGNGHNRGSGGAVANSASGTASIERCLIRNNIGGNGGGVYNGGMMTITDTKIDNNNGESQGGGVYNYSGASLTMMRTTISGNRATYQGGGVFNNGTMTIQDSTISGNDADDPSDVGAGGGILASDFGSQNSVTIITNSTVTNNIARSGGGGIYNYGSVMTLTSVTVKGNVVASDLFFHYGGGVVSDTMQNGTGSVTARNTIIADNSAASGIGPDYAGVLISQGYNLVENTSNMAFTGNLSGNVTGQDPRLGPLANNGGPTLTVTLLPGSPAIDTADPNTFPATDQRLFGRPVDGDGNGSVRADMGAFELGAIAVPNTLSPFDFDGDGKTDIGIFRPAPGEWWINRSSTSQTFAAQFGNPTDKPVPADFTGDGKTDIAFFRPGSGEWFILRSEDGTYLSFPFGTNGDVPLASNFDGDGKADVGVFRPSTNEWFIQKSTGGTIITTFGTAGDVPVVADYDGDGKTDIAIFRPSDGSWWYVRSSDNQFRVFSFGTSTDKPVQGDYTGDGRADIAVFRPSTGEWFIQRSEDNSYFSFPFGTSGDLPVPGDYDGDGRFDAGVFRPSSSTWFVNRTTAGILITNFGTTGDMPVPSAFVP